MSQPKGCVHQADAGRRPLKGKAERKPQLSLFPSRHMWGAARRKASSLSPFLGSYLGSDTLSSPGASSGDPGEKREHHPHREDSSLKSKRAPPKQSVLHPERSSRRYSRGPRSPSLVLLPQSGAGPQPRWEACSHPCLVSRQQALALHVVRIPSLNTSRPASFSREHSQLPTRLLEKKMRTRRGCGKSAEGREGATAEDG